MSSGRLQTGDYLARGASTTASAAGDFIAIMTAGAYGAVRPAQRTRPLVPEVL